MPQVSYPNLEAMYNTTAFTPFAMGMQQAQEAQRANQLNYDADQQKLEQLKFEAPISNATKLFDLQKRAREEDLASALYDQQKSNAVKKATVESKELSAKDIATYGQGLMQLGAAAKANGGSLPLSMMQSVDPEILKILQQPNGHEQIYNLGKAVHENSDKWLAQESKQGAAQAAVDTRADAMRDVADKNAAARLKAAELANARARAALAAKPAKQDALSYEKYAQKLDSHADELAMLGDAESLNKAQYFKNLAAEYYSRAVKLKTAPTDVKTDAQTSLETELGVRKPKPAGQAAPAAPATPNDRVRVQSADGKIGTIPRSQLKEAMAQGYKEYK